MDNANHNTETKHDVCLEQDKTFSVPTVFTRLVSIINHNQQHHFGRTLILIGAALMLAPVALCLGYMHLFALSSAVMFVAFGVECLALLQMYCPCGCGKKTRELSKLTPSKESRRLMKVEARKAMLVVALSYCALLSLIALPIPKPLYACLISTIIMCGGVFLLYLGASKTGHRLLRKPFVLRYKDLTVHDFADWSDKELDALIKHGLMTGALDGADLVSKFVLKKTEIMYLSDSERNEKPLQSETAPEADQASASAA
jgi:hypothetical protein